MAGYPSFNTGPGYDPSTGQPYAVTASTPGSIPQNVQTQITQELSSTNLPPSTAETGNLAQFEEQEFYAGNPLAGYTIPKGDMNAFLNMISPLETWMANTGYKYMPTIQQMDAAIQSGQVGDIAGLYNYFSSVTGANNVMPWAQYGMDSATYQKTIDSLNQSVYATTGQNDWASAGFDQGLLGQALRNGWGTTQLQAMITKNSALNSKYNWAQYGVSYQQLQSSKASSHAALAAQYGGNYTDQQAANALYVNPLQAFGASGQAVTSQSGPSGSSGGSGSGAAQAGQLGHASKIR